MAAGIGSISAVLIIVSVFVTNSISTSDPCAQLHNDTSIDTEYTYRCVLNNTFVQRCCSSPSDDDCVRLTQFIEMDEESELMNVTELVLANLTLENCAKPLIIEHIVMVEITDVTFRYCKHTCSMLAICTTNENITLYSFVLIV